ncbi:MAG: zinc-binding dehydrogenase [Micromonosporaceae bacterium]|nr:zinc-binding dehydrogenase [Micromonosporaceae bacterium]
MADMVLAAVQTAPRRIELREFPRPAVGPDDGLLRIEACGICGSDVETYHGLLGVGALPDAPHFVPGHEPLGIIEEIGERAATRWGVEPGDRVAVEVVVSCRRCPACLTGRYLSCSNRRGAYGVRPVTQEPALWGGFAEYMYLHPDSALHKVRKDLPAGLAVLFNPLGAGVRWATDLGGVRLGTSVLILGPGQRGLASVVAARAAGAGTVIVTGLAKDAAKLALAREFGADHTIVADEESTVDAVRELTGGAGVDVVLELTPVATRPVLDALSAVRHGGRIVLAGLKGKQSVELNTDLVVNKALTVVGAFGVDYAAYDEAIRIIESGRYPLAKMHTRGYSLADAGHAIDALAGDVPGEEAVHVAIMPNSNLPNGSR